ncbi:hypothetical protein ACJ5NV_14400 [Loktanella agnita]|uniref:hypothetical protein n=1 Tax=Loktanella agnita TaxID=287097 RepID=UPI003987B759
MKTLIPALLAAAIGTAAQAQDFYLGGSADYHFPHSGDAQTVGSLIAGLGIVADRFAVGAEIEAGLKIAGDNEYDTSRARGWASYDWYGYSFRVAGGVTEYYFDDSTSGGYNLGVGAERDFSPNMRLRGEIIRDFMDNSFTAAVTTSRIAVLYSF